MKHAVSLHKTVAKSKIVAPLPTPKTAKKTSPQIVTKKTAKKISGDATKTAKKKSAPTKHSAPTLAKKAVTTPKKVSAKLAKSSIKSVVKISPKKSAAKFVGDKSKISINKKTAKIVQPFVLKNNPKIIKKAKTQKPEIVKNNNEKIKSPSKIKIAIAPINSKKAAKSKTESKSVKTIQASKFQMAKTTVSAEKPQAAKTKLTTSAKNNVALKKPIVSLAKSKSNPKIKSKLIDSKIVAAKFSSQSPKTLLRKTLKPKSAAPKKLVEKSKNVRTFALPIMIDGITRKIKSVAAIRSSKRQIEKDVKTEALEVTAPVEEIKTRSAKPKKAKPIGSAIFRGVKERYDFKVFELGDIFEPIPAVYIISKRKTDRRKKGHHALICIGETASVSDELKRHRKGKCVKKHQANAVSILPEADEKARLKIENDLRAAHSVVCNLD